MPSLTIPISHSKSPSIDHVDSKSGEPQASTGKNAVEFVTIPAGSNTDDVT